MTNSPTSPMFQQSDLNRRGKAILDAARDSRAWIRGADGVGFVVVREALLDEAEQPVSVTVNLTAIDRALAGQQVSVPLDLAQYGAQARLEHLDAEILAEFVADIRGASKRGIREPNAKLFTEALCAW